MDLGLAGKQALVAGASSGLGLAIATELAAEGADVAICARDPERLERARGQVDAAGTGRALVHALDVRDQEAVVAWVDEVAGELGGLHIVVANAGGPPAGPATAHDLDAYRNALELSMLSQVGLVQAGLPHLRAAGWGRVLFVTSQSVRQPMAGLALSNAARPGVVGYAKSLVQELAGSQITVNVLAPGSHNTQRMVALTGEEDALAAWVQSIPLRRLGEPAELAAAAAFLASERASYITGAVLPVDGGSSGGLL